MKHPTTLLIHDLQAPDSHEDSHDLSFPWEVLRYGLEAETLKLTIEVLISDNVSRYYGIIREGVKLANGFAIQPDSVLMLTQAEQDAINASSELTDWIRENLEADEEARQVANERR